MLSLQSSPKRPKRGALTPYARMLASVAHPATVAGPALPRHRTQWRWASTIRRGAATATATAMTMALLALGLALALVLQLASNKERLSRQRTVSNKEPMTTRTCSAKMVAVAVDVAAADVAAVDVAAADVGVGVAVAVLRKLVLVPVPGVPVGLVGLVAQIGILQFQRTSVDGAVCTNGPSLLSCATM